MGSLRIDNGNGDDAAVVHFRFDGRTVTARHGDTVGAALWASGIKTLRCSPTAGAPRGMFCAMGSCQECVVRVDGIVKTACNTFVVPGLEVRTIHLKEGARP